ncbi:HAD-IA family hydrolase [Iodobacter sp. HSC-16F04]|uniref:HAD-IA family hydrolase n=1 Tax=Iodobacter violaceini TaxID=3044271 RepID=A0ABX0L2L0_9NEIS|nr:HAD-IA family hydrolase [Iodobacter violacea]NHQ87646.1 HAD-IA family hydrolase [Iodobacter violacea]
MNQCLLFDCDGTLVDSEWLCNLGLVIQFKELGVSLDADELVLRFRGWKLARILEILSMENDLALTDDFIPAYRAVVAQLFLTELKPVDGVLEMLSNMPQMKAVVSSGPLNKIRQALDVCGLSSYFGPNLYSSYEVGIWKPDPGIYQFAAQDMGFANADCIVVEDGLLGVEAGVKAGIQTYFYNPFGEACPFGGVIHFDSMKVLAELIRANKAMC